MREYLLCVNYKLCELLVTIYLHILMRESKFQLLLHLLDPCLKMKCEFGSKCQIREDSSVVCICDSCDPNPKDQPVCGNDGKTYSSYCHLKATGCKLGKEINVLKHEPCGKFSRPLCTCSSTYNNKQIRMLQL